MRWTGDAEGRRTRLSASWLAFTGSTLARERGRGWQAHLPAIDRRRYVGQLRAAADRRAPLQTAYRVRRHDGEIRLVVEEAVPRFDRDRQFTSFEGVCLDAEALAPATASVTEADELRSLSGRLETAREEERARLARELHDELGQVLTSTKLDLMWLCEQVRQPDARPSLSMVNKLQSLAGLVELAIVSVQRITTDLKPAVLDHLGLAAALEWEATKFQARTGIRCRVDAHLGQHALEPARAIALFRIAQESLTNVARHAHAGAVRLSLRRGRLGVVLDVQDNGRGITAAETRNPRSVGLLGMRERTHLLGGTFHVSGTPGRGTKISVSIPAGTSDT